MTIFTNLLGTSQEERNLSSKYFAVFDSEDTDDVAIVYQNKAGSINYVCDCCVTRKYHHAVPILKRLGRWNDDVKAKEGGNIEKFLEKQKSLGEQLGPYYKKLHRFESHESNDYSIRNRPSKIQYEIADLENKIIALRLEIEAKKQELPTSEEAVREHLQILAEGLPEIPPSDIVRLETLTEGEEGQKPLFPETA